jgi:2-methylcitrate dehydratase PrpD
MAPEFEAEFPAKAAAEVVVETLAGETFRSGRVEALWEPPDTLPSDQELEVKFRWLVNPVLGSRRCEQLVSMIWALDDHPDARALIQLSQKRPLTI